MLSSSATIKEGLPLSAALGLISSWLVPMPFEAGFNQYASNHPWTPIVAVEPPHCSKELAEG